LVVISDYRGGFNDSKFPQPRLEGDCQQLAFEFMGYVVSTKERGRGARESFSTSSARLSGRQNFEVLEFALAIVTSRINESFV